MIDRTVKLRWRRRVRRGRQQVEDLGVQTEESLDKHLFRRFSRIYGVRRFLSAWIFLTAALITGIILQTQALSSYYQVLRPVPGGTYTEGIIGSFNNANPLYASGSVDTSVSKLVFSGLLTYDNNNQLVGDLATDWRVEQNGLRYTVHLRKDVKWHDGTPFTSDDVAFTYKTIQNPDARSNLQSSWTDIRVEQPDAYTVVFTLPNILSSFPYALTNGIVPKHVLESIPAGQLRSARFNTTHPVGTGPFRWEVLQVEGASALTRQESIGLEAYAGYHRGAPKLQQFVVRSFRDETQMLSSYNDGQLDAMVGLNSIVDKEALSTESHEYNIPLTGQLVVFFKNDQPVLKDPKVRQALVAATDTDRIIKGLDHSVVGADGPLLKSHLGYDPKLVQLQYNTERAQKLLAEAGWKKGEDGLLVKDGKPLQFTLYAQSIGEYAYVTRQLQEQWRAVGANVEVKLLSDSELQTSVALHSYDALLYGISLGNDPDVFAYWHSSQADPRAATRLNLSEYKSIPADRALEAGRSRVNQSQRAKLYKPFLEAWRSGAPAVVLYQPRFLYVTRERVVGFQSEVLNNATDRFVNVHNWMIKQAKTNR